VIDRDEKARDDFGDTISGHSRVLSFKFARNCAVALVSRRDTVDRSIGLGGSKASEQEELQ
jgi:hypothetical protein